VVHAFAVRLPELVADLGGELIGPAAEIAAVRIERIGSIDDATPSTITFIASERLQPLLVGSTAACVIVGPSLREVARRRGPAIVTPDPYLYFARLTQWWAKRTRPPLDSGVHPSAVVDPTAQIGATASIGALCVIEAGAVVGEGVAIGAHCFIGRHARVGAGTKFAARVTLNERCHVGSRCTLHSGVVIGADGFGFAPTEGRWEKIEQLGAVSIGDDVDIGANTCIDRGALGDTLIGNGVKLDNLIQIGHNVRIGDHTAIAGCVGIAGSAVIGRHCTFGGAAMIAGHLEIVDHTHISGGTLVSHSIRKPGHYTGVFPIDDNAAWEKNAATLRNLHRLRERVRGLEKAVAAHKNETGSP
jgi:UDP-3-O-[3-hydroxymyristoyl] glucosamine N-acyltransferase